jgi:hypothetical protein
MKVLWRKAPLGENAFGGIDLEESSLEKSILDMSTLEESR